MSRELNDSGLLSRALSPLAKLPAGVLCSQLTAFLTEMGKVGFDAAVAGLSGPTGWTVLGVAGLFGVSEAWQSGKEKKKAHRLAEEMDRLAETQSTALELLCNIADGEIGITLDGITQLELTDRIVDGLASAGLATGEQIDRLQRELRDDRAEQRIYHNTADLMLRELLRQRGDDASELPAPNNNFVEADITPNLDFVGRVDVLDDLHRQLASGSVAITHSVSGEGGIGKTQVAAKYALEHGADYDGRWWLDASGDAINQKTAALAEKLGLGLPPNAPPEQIRQAVCQRLSQGRHLLILDNLERLEDLDGFTLTDPSRVLITTRKKNLPPGRVQDFPLDVLQRGESIDLLRKHRKDLAGAEHEEGLGSVAEHLGDHSLAVALAASYLRKRQNVDPTELLDRLQRTDVGAKEHLFESLDPAEHAVRYRLSIYASLTLHLPDFRDTPAMKLLGLAAFCHPDAIPLDVFFDVSGEAPEAIEKQLEALADVSIIRYGKTVSLHRLMQEAIRVEIGEEAHRKRLTSLVDVLANRFEGVLDHRNWAKQDLYAAHARTALTHVERLGEVRHASFLGNQLGLYFQNRVRFNDALAALRCAERIDRAAYGDEHPEVAADVSNIGGVLLDKGDLVGGLTCYREAERIHRAAYGNDHPTVAVSVNNIGAVLQDKGDLDGALTCYREAERIGRKAYGNDHPKIAIRVNNIGSVLKEQGDLDGALTCFREAEGIDRAAYGKDHPKIAIHVNNIGSVLKAQGDLDGALTCFREAERIDRTAYGNDHPEVATDVNNIGSVLKAQGDLDGALTCYREAERIDRAAYGNDHPTVAVSVNNIGTVLSAQGDRDGALRMVSEAFRIFLTTVGPRAWTTMSSARNLRACGVDPLSLAGEIAGEAVAEELRHALAERDDP